MPEVLNLKIKLIFNERKKSFFEDYAKICSGTGTEREREVEMIDFDVV